ncbi:flavin reductase family protein [Sphingomonas daechungensis]|uniref:flavin reductase family protein n=1 Tax=Sphingomonas daechungensis TaxID=1176646 RepID=UPI003782ED5A
MPSRPYDSGMFRKVLGHYPTGVAVVSTMKDGLPRGMIVGSFTSVSLDPPLVGFLPNKTSQTWWAIDQTRTFCVNILASDQVDLLKRFSGPRETRFFNQDYQLTPGGSPALEGCVGWIDCSLQVAHPAGDHMIVIGLVENFEIYRCVEPMVFVRGRYRAFEALCD